MYTHSISIHIHWIFQEHIYLGNCTYPYKPPKFDEPPVVFLLLQLVKLMRPLANTDWLDMQHPNRRIQKYPESRNKESPIFILWQFFPPFFYTGNHSIYVLLQWVISLSLLNSFRWLQRWVRVKDLELGWGIEIHDLLISTFDGGLAKKERLVGVMIQWWTTYIGVEI